MKRPPCDGCTGPGPAVWTAPATGRRFCAACVACGRPAVVPRDAELGTLPDAVTEAKACPA